MIGRENTMFIAFASKASASGAVHAGHDPVWFVILSGLVFFAWGEIYSLFPRPAPTLRREFATTNAGLLYTAKAPRPCWCRSRTTCSNPRGIGTRYS